MGFNRVIFVFLIFSAALPSIGQESISGGNRSDCTRNTCLWNPFHKQQSFLRDNLTYGVETTGKAAGDFILRSGPKTLLDTELKDLSSNVWVTWSPDNQRFAVTWSDGGELGGFHVRVFEIEAERVRELFIVDRAVKDFQLRHYCKTRGNNVEAYRWDTPNRLVVLTSVYPTSDCGQDLGHTEGYIVHVENGHILSRMNSTEVKLYMEQHPEWPSLQSSIAH
jgi:hypothetical protein